jgi:lipopolysaccharide transport system ATP-binding protein
MNQIEVRAVSKYYRPAKERISVFDTLPVIGRIRRENAERKATARLAAGGKHKAKVQGIWALRDVTFDVGRGEALGIIGANGAGKSTLLRVLARVTMPTSGKIHGRGRLVSLLELGMGFQPELTARANIHLYGALYDIPSKVVDAQFDEIVAFAGIEKVVDNPLRTYSSGMYLRLAFSVALNLKPNVLLADEVLAVGDLSFQESCIERVRSFRDEGGTTLFVSHDMTAIRRICDRVLWLQDGQVRALGSTDQVVAAYESYMYEGETATKGKRDKLAGNEFISIRAARLLNEVGDEIGALRVGSDAIFEVRIETHHPNADFYLGVDVYGFVGGKQHVLRLLQERVSAHQSGLHTVRLRIPQHCFVDIPYTVNVAAVAVRDGIEHAVVAQSAFGFRAYTIGLAPEGGAANADRSKGVMRPQVTWSVEPPIQERQALL